MDEAPPGTTLDDEIIALPHWPRVAFAARCARRVAPLYPANWPDAPDEQIESLSRAIELAERSASAGSALDGLEEAAIDAGVAIGAAFIAIQAAKVDQDRSDEHGGSLNIAATAARVAQQATLSASSTGDEATLAAREAVSDAFDAILQAGRDDLLDGLERDLERLRKLVRRRWRWRKGDATGPDVFEAL